MKGLRLMAGLSILALLFCLGCSSDSSDGGISGDPVESQITEPEFEALMESIVVPPIKALDFSFLAPPATDLSSRDRECEDFSEAYCTEGGTAEICIGQFSFDIYFDDCSNEKQVVSGEVSGTPTSEDSFDLDMDLTLGDLELSGSMTMKQKPGCVREKPDRLGINSPEGNALFDGSLLYCGGEYPEGSLDVYMVSSGVFDYQFELDLDGSQTAIVIVSDISSGDLLLSCTYDMDSGEGNCMVP